MKADSPGLDTLERWMQAVVMHPGRRTRPGCARGRRGGWSLWRRATPGNVVLPSKQLSSVERIEIYAHMYYARLVEVMEAEYPTVRQLLGPRAFAAACRRYRGEASVAVAPVERPERGLPRLPGADTAALAPARACRRHRTHRARDGGRVRRAGRHADDGGGVCGGRRSGRGCAVNPALVLLELRYPANAIHERAAPRRAAAHPAPAGVMRHRFPPRLPGAPPRAGAGAVPPAESAGRRQAARACRAREHRAAARSARTALPDASRAGSRNGPAPTCSSKGTLTFN